MKKNASTLNNQHIIKIFIFSYFFQLKVVTNDGKEKIPKKNTAKGYRSHLKNHCINEFKVRARRLNLSCL